MQKQQIRSKIPTYFIPLVLIMAASLSACQYTLEEILATATASSLTETAAEIQLTQIAACQSDATNCGEGNQDPRIQFVGILDIPDQVQADKPFTVKVASNYPQPSPLLAYQGNIIIEIDGVVACEFSLDTQLSAPVYLFGIPGLGLLSGGQRAGDCTIDISQLGFHKLAAISYGNDVYRRAVVETIIEVVVEPTIPTCQSDATYCGNGENDPQIQFVEVPDFPEQIQTGEPLLVKVASNYPQPGGLLAYQGNIIIEIDDVVACEFSLDTQLSAPVYLFGSQLIVGDQWVGDCTVDVPQLGIHKLTAISYANDVYRRAVVETVIEVIDSGEPLPPTPTCQSDATYCGGGTQDPGIKFVEVPDFPDQILADEPFTVKVASNYPDQPYFPSNLAYQANIIIEIDGVVACEFSLDTQLSEPQYLFGSPASGILLGGQRTGECMIDIPQLGFHKLAAISYGNNVYRRAVVETVIEVVVEPTTPTCQTDATFCGEGQNDPRIQFVGVPEFPEQIQTSEPLLVKVASNYPQPGRLLGYRGNIIVEIDDIFACEFSLDEQLAPPIYALGSLLIAGDQWVGDCTIDLPQPGIHKLTAISYANDIYQRSVVETIIEVIGSGAPPAPTATPTPPHTPTPPPTSTPSPTPTPTSSSTPTATEVSLSAVQMLLFSSAIAPIPPGTTVTFEVFVRSESGDLVGVVEIFSDNGESCSAGIQGSESVICTFRFDSIGRYGVSAVFTSTNGQHDSSSQGTVIIVEEVKVESAPTEEDEPTPKASPTPTEEPK